MKVLLLSHLFPTKADPTHGVFNKQIFTAISKQCDAYTIVPIPFWLFQNTLPPDDIDENLNIEYCHYFTLPRIQSKRAMFMYYGISRYIHNLRDRFPFDAILASWAYPDIVAAQRISKDFNVPVIANVLGSDINLLLNKPSISNQILYALNRSDKVITVSDALGEKLNTHGIDYHKIVTQHNGVDINIFKISDKLQLRNRLNIPNDKRIIGYIGRLSHEKGPDILLNAVAKLVHEHLFNDISVVIVGNGSMKELLLEMIDKLDIRKYIIFVGNQPHNEIPYWVGSFDILCLPSRNEGCPNVVLEASASGVPVVAARAGGVPEIVSDQNGVIADIDSPSHLAYCLAQALNKKWIPEQIRYTVESHTWDHAARGYISVIENAISERSISYKSRALVKS